MQERQFFDGRLDGLEPLESLDPAACGSFAELLRAMSKTAFGGRQLGEALDVLLAMAADDECRAVLTISGAMTVAKQGTMICSLIERGLVDCVVATGALIAHGLTESIGRVHYRYDPASDDETLFKKGYNRVYDTLEMEGNLNDVERLVRTVLEENEPEDGVWSSARFCRAVGAKLAELDQGRGILRSAFEREVPVFIPAFTDSEVGLDVATWAMNKGIRERGEDPKSLRPVDLFAHAPHFNPFHDLFDYARLMAGSKRAGIFTIGGGVPRNWAQQVGPFFDIINYRLGAELEPLRFRYGVRICPEPVHWGGLSGCTYSEGVSWGKFVPVSEGGRFAEVYADATIVLPFLVKALLEELDREVPP